MSQLGEIKQNSNIARYDEGGVFFTINVWKLPLDDTMSNAPIFELHSPFQQLWIEAPFNQNVISKAEKCK